MNIYEHEDAHCLRVNEDLYAAMDDMAEFARNTNPPINHPTKEESTAIMADYSNAIKHQVLRYMRTQEEATTRDVALALGLDLNRTSNAMTNLKSDGKIIDTGWMKGPGTGRGNSKMWKFVPGQEDPPPAMPDASTIVQTALSRRIPMELAWCGVEVAA